MFKYVCMYICKNVCMHLRLIYVCMRRRMYIWVSTYTHLFMYVYIYICMYVCRNKNMIVCMYVCMYVWMVTSAMPLGHVYVVCVLHIFICRIHLFTRCGSPVCMYVCRIILHVCMYVYKRLLRCGCWRGGFISRERWHHTLFQVAAHMEEVEIHHRHRAYLPIRHGRYAHTYIHT